MFVNLRLLLFAATAAVLSGCDTSAEDTRPAGGWNPYATYSMVDGHNGPYELILQNRLAHRYAMTEIRALNNLSANGAIDVGVTSSVYNDPRSGGLRANTGFVVTESGLDGMVIKSNNGPIDFITYPDLSIRLQHGRVEMRESSQCPAPAPANGLNLCVAANGVLYATGRNGTVTALASP